MQAIIGSIPIPNKTSWHNVENNTNIRKCNLQQHEDKLYIFMYRKDIYINGEKKTPIANKLYNN